MKEGTKEEIPPEARIIKKSIYAPGSLNNIFRAAKI